MYLRLAKMGDDQVRLQALVREGVDVPQALSCVGVLPGAFLLTCSQGRNGGTTSERMLHQSLFGAG
jgi:hypothetical protein